LGRPAQLPEQPADVPLVVANTELFLDDASDAGTGPDLPSGAISLRPVPEELWDAAFLVGGELGRMARRGPRPESLAARAAGTGEQAADRYLGGTEGLGDVALIPALLLQVQRPQPPPLTPAIRSET